ITIGEGAVWVVSGPMPAAMKPTDRTITRIDPATNAVVDTITRVGDILWMAAGEGALWVPSPSTNEVLRLDPATHAITARIPVPTPGAIAVEHGAVWVKSGTYSALNTLTRIDPAT